MKRQTPKTNKTVPGLSEVEVLDPPTSTEANAIKKRWQLPATTFLVPESNRPYLEHLPKIGCFAALASHNILSYIRTPSAKLVKSLMFQLAYPFAADVQPLTDFCQRQLIAIF